MSASTSAVTNVAESAGSTGKTGKLNLEIQSPERRSLDSADGSHFRAASQAFEQLPKLQ